MLPEIALSQFYLDVELSAESMQSTASTFDSHALTRTDTLLEKMADERAGKKGAAKQGEKKIVSKLQCNPGTTLMRSQIITVLTTPATYLRLQRH